MATQVNTCESQSTLAGARLSALLAFAAVGVAACDDPGDVDQASGVGQVGVRRCRVRVGVALQVACARTAGLFRVG